MAKYSNTIEYNISTKLDASGLTKLQSQIKQVELSLQRMGDKEFLNSDRVGEARKQLEGLNTSLTKSFNSSLGILDLSKLQKELLTAGVDAKGLGTAFNMAGAQGQAALNSLVTQIGNFNGGIERTSSQIDKIFTTFSNTFRWGLISSFFSNFINNIHQSVDYVKELDDSLTQIMLVTDYNRDSMNEYAKSANEAAKALSMSTTGMTNASLVFAQQGYNLSQSQELATLSAKLANASQQDTATTSDQITAYMNAYGLQNSIEELTQQMDNWALIANVSAADVGELAQASQRAASMANAVGVSGEQLAAQIATIESVTREAPEQIGNGLKTLYARFSDIEAGGEDEEGFTLGKITTQLNAIGVQILDQFGNIRDVGDIMEDLMVIWDDLDQTSKVAASQALAGKYQVNRFMALMDNSGMYQEYKGATGDVATGTLDQMNQEYAESLAGRTQKLHTTLEGLFNDIFTTDMVYPLIDALTKLADGIDTVFKSIGNGPTILLTLASAFGQLFSTNIARSVNNMISNQQLQEVRKNNIANVGNVLDQLGLGDSEMGQYIKTMAQNAPKMNQEQYDQYMAALQDWASTTTQLAAKEEELQGTLDVLNMVYGTKLETPSAVNRDDETGKISFTEAEEARANLSNKQLTALASKEDFVEETQQIMSLSRELGKAQTAYENFKSGAIESAEALERFDLASDQVEQQLESLKNVGILSDASFKQLKESFSRISDELITGTDDIDALEKELDELIRRFVNLGEAAGSMDPNTFKRWILSGIEQAKKQEQELQGLRVQDEQNKGTATGQIENIVSQNAIEGVIKVTSSLGELAGAIITVQNLGQIWTNDDLSPMEKFVQILTGIGILIPTVLTSIKSMSDGIKALKEAQIIENTALAAHQILEVAGLKIKQQNIIKNIENATSMKAETVAAAELAGVNTALATAETAAGAAATKLAGGLASIWAALGPIGIAIIGLTAILGGSALKYLWDEAKEAEAQQKAFNELADQTQETANKLSETVPALNDLYEAYQITGEASDEFKQSLADQAELLGINDAALLISQGKYEELKAKIDEATEAVYNNNAALQQIKLDKINPNDMVNELSDDQKERYGITYHQEEGIVNLSGGTAEKGLVNKLDQTPYELVKAAQQDIETQQERINSLTQKRNDLVKEGLTATEEASQKIAEDITKVDEELANAAQKLAESKSFIEDHNDVITASEAIRDNTLNQELNSEDSIFNNGSYEDIRKFISAQQGVDSSNIDELIQKYAELAGNADAAAKAAENLKEKTEEIDPISTQEKLINSLPENNFRTDEEQQRVKEDLDLEEEEYWGYQSSLLDNNANLQALRDSAIEAEHNAEAIQKQRVALENETKALVKNRDQLIEKSESLKDNDRLYARNQRSIQNLNKQIEANRKKMSEDLRTSDDYEDQLADLENKIIETALGAKELGEVWEDNSNILRDSESDWAQQAEAINNLAPGLAHLLNLDLAEVKSLPTTFFTNTQNLNDMEAAINGNVEALQRLRGEAALELLVKAGVDPNSDLYGEMLSLIEEANQVLPDIEAGATLNDAPFIETLNAMIASTIAAGGDIESVLATYERLGLQFTQTGTTTMRVPRIRTETSTGMGKYDPNDPAQEAAISTYTVNPVVEWENVEVPTYEYKKTSGGQGFTGGYEPKSSGGGGGGKGGGGKGGGSKAKTIEPKEKKDHQKDYYEEVNSQLNKTEKILSKIEKEEDRLIGDKARANQNKQLKLLQKEIDLNNKKLGIQKQELSDVDKLIKEQDKLAEKAAKNAGVNFSIPDVILDADGIVSNYEEISKSIDDIHNKLIDKYNEAAKAGNEELTKQLEKTISQFDKYGESILKGAQRHNELKAEIEGTIGELEDLKDAIEDIRIDAWKASTEAIDNLKELRESAAELEGFFSEYESDSPFRALIEDAYKLDNIYQISKKDAKDYYNEIIAGKEKALKKTKNADERVAIQTSIDYFKSLRDNLSDNELNNGLLGLAYQDMLQLKEWFDNPTAKDNIFGNNTAALKEAYEEAYNRVHDMLLEQEKWVEDYRDHIIDAYDDIEDKQNRQIDKFDRIVDKLEQFSDMYALYYGDESYDMMRDILQQQGNTLREQLNQQKTLYEYWSEQYVLAVQTGDEKLMNELEDKMNDAEDKMADLAKDAAKAFADSYENAVKASTQHIIQNTIGDKNFDRLDRNWEWDKDYLEKYRDDVEKAYEMDKLRNKYTDLLNQAQGASLQTQDKIRAQMQEQLALLDGQATVSEYDVKLANAKLEILQKQIALEDAQRNKNQMKLRRDTQGNYRYVYTANQNDVSGAQQDLLDSEYDAYELSKNQQMNNYDELINAYKRYLSQREEILNNANLSEQEKLDQNAELYDKFLKFVDRAKEDFSDAAYGTLDILNWLTLNGTDYTTTAAVDMLNKLLDEQGNIKDATGVIWMDNATYLTDEVIPKISGAVEAADNDIKNRLIDLRENMVGSNGVIPEIVNGIEGEDGLTTALDEARTATDGLVVSTKDLMEALNGDSSALVEAQAQLQNYLKELNNVKNASSITAQQLRDTQKELDKSEAEKLNYKTQLDDLASGKKVIKNGKIVDPNAEKKKSKSTSSGGSSKKNGELTGFTGVYHADSWGGGDWGDWYAGEKDAVRISSFSRESGYGPYNVHLETKSGGWLGWVKESQLFNTGGYTGKWADGDKKDKGKLAFLHQKELVLNAEDTKNILAAVDIVRQIGTGLRNSISSMNLPFGKALNTIGDTIEQRVEITASFPNATDADDIRQALIGLSDKAYQYAHRTI